MTSAQVRSRIQYATDFQPLSLTRPFVYKPLDLLRLHIGRSTKVTDVLAVSKSTMSKAIFFKLSLLSLQCCFVFSCVLDPRV